MKVEGVSIIKNGRVIPVLGTKLPMSMYADVVVTAMRCCPPVLRTLDIL
jgi:hypothetical protein